MTTTCDVSVIVNNYNYERFLSEAIESALDQTYRDSEVIVVDDGSTDGSRAIIEGYGERVIPIFKSNGGQMSAFNAGFARARGDIVIFLDADDRLFPHCASSVASVFSRHLSKVHWPLLTIDSAGNEIGIKPGHPLPSGSLLRETLGSGPHHTISPTSGNAWSRRFLERVMPMPEHMPWMAADGYLFSVVGLFGPVRAFEEPLACYRLHGDNNYAALGFEDKLALDIRSFDARCAVLAEMCRELGHQVDPSEWKRESWLGRLASTFADVQARISAEQRFILIDNDEWGMSASESMRPVPFPEDNGEFAGPPPDDGMAIAELERMRVAGCNHLVIGWPAYWWLDHYTTFRDYLFSSFHLVESDDRLMLFDLTKSPAPIASEATVSGRVDATR